VLTTGFLQRIDGGLKLEGDEKVGSLIVKRALEGPIRRSSRTRGQRDRRAGQKRDVPIARLRRREHGVRRHAEGGHHRPNQGGAGGAAERGVGCIAAADDGGADHGSAGGEAGGAADAARKTSEVVQDEKAIVNV